MCAVVGLVGRDPLAVCELPMDLSVKIGKGFTQVGVELPHTRLVGRRPWLRGVVDEIVGKQLVEYAEVSFALNLVVISTNDRFGGFRNRVEHSPLHYMCFPRDIGRHLIHKAITGLLVQRSPESTG